VSGTYAADRAEQAENALDIRVAAFEAWRDCTDENPTDGPYHAGLEREPS
jgi:hypothetical protein